MQLGLTVLPHPDRSADPTQMEEELGALSLKIVESKVFHETYGDHAVWGFHAILETQGSLPGFAPTDGLSAPGSPQAPHELVHHLPLNAPLAAFQRQLRVLGNARGADLILRTLEVARAPKKLAVFDMDSTLIEAEVIDEYARELGLYDQVSAITASAMRGEIDFDTSFTRRMALLKSLPRDKAEGIWDRIRLVAGARELFEALRKNGARTAILSGGFTHIAEKVCDELGVNHVLCNTMPFENDKATGHVAPPIVNAEAKRAELERLRASAGLKTEETLAVGDGANDIPMLVTAGLGIAFRAKPRVQEAVGNSLSGPRLHAVIPLLSFPL